MPGDARAQLSFAFACFRPHCQGPTRWVGRLEEAYEAEVARQGGLHSARPKALLEALQPEFPELTLQIIKWQVWVPSSQKGWLLGLDCATSLTRGPA